MSDNGEPRLSIVIPVYNGRQYIQDTLQSLEGLEQSISCEFIFQNSKSVDGTSEVLDNFCRGRANRFHYNEKDSGQSDAINTGMARAKGKWVTWLCADDVILPELVQALDEAEKQLADVIYGDVIFINGKDIFPAIGTEYYSPGILSKKRLIIQQPGTCILRNAWEKVNGLRCDRNWAMDYDLFMKLETLGKKFHRAECFVAIIRIHPEAKTSSGSIKRLWEMWSIIRESHGRKPVYFRLRPYLVYGVEYIIKALEAQSPLMHRTMARKGVGLLHRFFWWLAVSAEHQEISTRFQNIPTRTRTLAERMANVV